jgi:outer membrane protein
MTIKILTLVLLLLLLTPLIAFSEEKELTLKESVDIALKENPNMRKAESIVRQSDDAINQSRGSLLPQVDTGAQYQRIGNITTLNLSSINIEGSFADVNNYKYYVTLNQLLFDLRVWTGYEISKLNFLNATYQYDITKQTVIYNVDKAYYSVLEANSFFGVAKETVTQYELHLSNTQKEYKQGTVPKYDVLKVEVSLAAAQQDYITANNNVAISKANFNNSLGIDLSTPVNIKEYLKYEPWDIEYKECLSCAFQNRPEVKQMANMMDIADKQIKYAKGERYPSVNLNAGYYGQNANLIQQPNGWNLTVQASVPIFHGGIINAKIEQAEEQFQQSKEDQTLLLQSVELDVKQSYLNMKAALDKINVSSKNVIQAEESMRMADLRYKGGVANIQELLDTQTSLISAKNDYIKAVYEYEMAKVNLKKAMGIVDKM